MSRLSEGGGVARRLGENLLAQREEAGMSQEALRERASLHRTDVGQIERGMRVPVIATLIRLAGALPVEPRVLLMGIEWESDGRGGGRFHLHEPGDAPSQLAAAPSRSVGRPGKAQACKGARQIPKEGQVAWQFARNLRALRAEAGMTPSHLGMRAALHRTQIRQLERGERAPRVDTLIKLAGALSVDPGGLLEGVRWIPGTVIPGEYEVGGEGPGPPPNHMYDLITVEEVVLSEVVSLHPRHLTANGIFQSIAVDSSDPREKEVVSLAIQNLRELNVLQGGAGGAVRPTDAALRVGLLFLGCASEARESHREAPAECDSGAPARPGGLGP